MTKAKDTKATKKAPPTSKPDLAATAEGAPALEKTESVVDTAFDALNAWAVKSLAAAKRGLEASARWLDARAKVVGELATKLQA